MRSWTRASWSRAGRATFCSRSPVPASTGRHGARRSSPSSTAPEGHAGTADPHARRHDAHGGFRWSSTASIASTRRTVGTTMGRPSVWRVSSCAALWVPGWRRAGQVVLAGLRDEAERTYGARRGSGLRRQVLRLIHDEQATQRPVAGRVPLDPGEQGHLELVDEALHAAPSPEGRSDDGLTDSNPPAARHRPAPVPPSPG